MKCHPFKESVVVVRHLVRPILEARLAIAYMVQMVVLPSRPVLRHEPFWRLRRRFLGLGKLLNDGRRMVLDEGEKR